VRSLSTRPDRAEWLSLGAVALAFIEGLTLAKAVGSCLDAGEKKPPGVRRFLGVFAALLTYLRAMASPAA
jgi:hypothetical protein